MTRSCGTVRNVGNTHNAVASPKNRLAFDDHSAGHTKKSKPIATGKSARRDFDNGSKSDSPITLGPSNEVSVSGRLRMPCWSTASGDDSSRYHDER